MYGSRESIMNMIGSVGVVFHESYVSPLVSFRIASF